MGKWTRNQKMLLIQTIISLIAIFISIIAIILSVYIGSQQVIIKQNLDEIKARYGEVNYLKTDRLILSEDTCIFQNNSGMYISVGVPGVNCSDIPNP